MQFSFKNSGKLVMKMKNFYANGNSFSKAFSGTTSAQLFLEIWERKTRYNAGNLKHHVYVMHIKG